MRGERSLPFTVVVCRMYLPVTIPYRLFRIFRTLSFVCSFPPSVSLSSLFYSLSAGSMVDAVYGYYSYISCVY